MSRSAALAAAFAALTAAVAVAAERPAPVRARTTPVRPRVEPRFTPTAVAAPRLDEVVVGKGGDYAEIAEAVQGVSAGTVIKVKPGKYTQPVVLDKNVTIVGDGKREKIILDVKDGYAMVVDTDKARIKGLTIRC